MLGHSEGEELAGPAAGEGDEEQQLCSLLGSGQSDSARAELGGLLEEQMHLGREARGVTGRLGREGHLGR